MKKEIFLVSLGMAAGLGLSEVELGEARAAFVDTKHEVVELTLGSEALNTLETFLDNQACAFVNAKFNLSGTDVCILNEDSKYTFSGKVFNQLNEATQETIRTGTVRVRIPVQGSFVAGELPE